MAERCKLLDSCKQDAAGWLIGASYWMAERCKLLDSRKQDGAGWLKGASYWIVVNKMQQDG